MTRDYNILYETANYYVTQVRGGFEVYKNGVTHSVRCSQIGYSGEVGLLKAIAEADRRELEHKTK